MLRMSNLLEHVCTIFTLNENTSQCYLKIFLDARGLDRNALTASLNSNNEIVVKADIHTYNSDELLHRQVQNVLTVPHNVKPENTQIIILRNGFLLLNIPYQPAEAVPSPNDNFISKHPIQTSCQKYTKHITCEKESSSELDKKPQINHLENHQTIRKGNKLTLIIPLDRTYRKEDIKISVVHRSLCITATRLEDSIVCHKNHGKSCSQVVQRTFYKEYEASDCTPDSNSITFNLDNQCLFVDLNVIPDT